MAHRYVNAAFNLPINSLFTYYVPEILQDKIQAGMRLFAPFGRRNLTGIALEFPDENFSIKNAKRIRPIIKLLDDKPILNTEMLNFCKWISEYYACPVGEAVFSAIPKGISVESKIVYKLTDDETRKIQNLDTLQNQIIHVLRNRQLSLKQIENKLKEKDARGTIKNLLKKNLITEEYFTNEAKVKPRFETFVVFDHLEEFNGYNASMLENFLRENKIRSEHQAGTLKYLIEQKIKEIRLSELTKNAEIPSSTVNSLAKKGLITIDRRQVQRQPEDEFGKDENIVELNFGQKSILHEIISALQSSEFKTFLLFGVTGSGKTQVYLEAIKEALAAAKTAIVLVPEISLTPQLIYRFKNFFGDIIGVMHSKLSEGERFDVYNRIKNNEVKIAVGARSAIFAPLENLGIIIVDEEHDQSYKQSEKNPKYNARDSALVRGKMNNAVVVLGSATPSLESFYNAKQGKYTLLELPHRAMKTRQPAVEIVNMMEELKHPDKYRKFESPEKKFLSSKLIAYIDQALNRKQSVILLQNRRGYSAYIECRNCGNVKMCKNCDITMIYHKTFEQLRCHYCGLIERLPENCEKCGSRELKLKGTGTEKVEEEIERLFPQAKVRRMDSDTVRRKGAHRKILKSFHDREFDILVGTQMISKGLDFPNVFLVGVISADIGLLVPDFRASERTFQLLMQVAGRSGRISDYGRVVIQTVHPENNIFTYVRNHDYVSFYQEEIGFRKDFDYPPFSRMTLIEIKGDDATHVKSVASRIYLFLEKQLKGYAGNNVEIFKPTPALIFKIKNKYRYHIIIKALRNQNDRHPGISIQQLQDHIAELKLKSSEQINIDVDPLSFS